MDLMAPVAEGRPDPRERQDDVARVPLEIGKQPWHTGHARAAEVLLRDGSQHLGWRWSKQRDISAQRQRDPESEVSLELRRRNHTPFELLSEPLAVEEFATRWVAPGPDVGLSDDG